MQKNLEKGWCPEFALGCNVYTEKNYEAGFADAFKFLKKYHKFIGKKEYLKINRYLKRKRNNAVHHFKEKPVYYGAQMLGMTPGRKFVTIDAWLTKGVKGRKHFTEVEIDADCMIMCKCGHCLTRQEARGNDPFVMKPEDFERKTFSIRQSWGD